MTGSGDTPAGADDRPPEDRALEWQVYADATCAGLSALIPLPLLDLAFEGLFRRRMARAIARFRGLEVAPQHLEALGKAGPWLSVAGCLALPFKVALWLLIKLWRKLIYPLAVIDATHQVSEYWHRARLVDHLLGSGHLEEDPERALDTFARTLDEADPSPIRGAAEEVVRSAKHVLRTLVRVRRHGASRVPDELRARLDASWDRIEGSLDRLVAEYERLYRTVAREDAS